MLKDCCGNWNRVTAAGGPSDALVSGTGATDTTMRSGGAAGFCDDSFGDGDRDLRGGRDLRRTLQVEPCFLVGHVDAAVDGCAARICGWRPR